jgi:hypothetical protein
MFNVVFEFTPGRMLERIVCVAESLVSHEAEPAAP